MYAMHSAEFTVSTATATKSTTQLKPYSLNSSKLDATDFLYLSQRPVHVHSIHFVYDMHTYNTYI